MRRPGSLCAWGVGLALVAAASTLTACSALFPPSSGGTASDSEISRSTDSGGQDVDVFSISVGDCFDDVGEDEVSELPLVDCAEEHDYEVFDEFEIHDDGDFPGTTAMEDLADERCSELFEDFVGIPLEDSILNVATLSPTADTWDNGDRTVSCMVTNPGVKTTGTLEGLGI